MTANTQLATYRERVRVVTQIDRLADKHLHDHNVVPRRYAGWNCQLSTPSFVVTESDVVPAVHVAYV